MVCICFEYNSKLLVRRTSTMIFSIKYLLWLNIVSTHQYMVHCTGRPDNSRIHFTDRLIIYRINLQTLSHSTIASGEAIALILFFLMTRNYVIK